MATSSSPPFHDVLPPLSTDPAGSSPSANASRPPPSPSTGASLASFRYPPPSPPYAPTTSSGVSVRRAHTVSTTSGTRLARVHQERELDRLRAAGIAVGTGSSGPNSIPASRLDPFGDAALVHPLPPSSASQYAYPSASAADFGPGSSRSRTDSSGSGSFGAPFSSGPNSAVKTSFPPAQLPFGSLVTASHPTQQHQQPLYSVVDGLHRNRSLPSKYSYSRGLPHSAAPPVPSIHTSSQSRNSLSAITAGAGFDDDADGLQDWERMMKQQQQQQQQQQQHADSGRDAARLGIDGDDVELMADSSGVLSSSVPVAHSFQWRPDGLFRSRVASSQPGSANARSPPEFASPLADESASPGHQRSASQVDAAELDKGPFASQATVDGGFLRRHQSLNRYGGRHVVNRFAGRSQDARDDLGGYDYDNYEYDAAAVEGRGGAAPSIVSQLDSLARSSPRSALGTGSPHRSSSPDRGTLTPPFSLSGWGSSPLSSPNAAGGGSGGSGGQSGASCVSNSRASPSRLSTVFDDGHSRDSSLGGGGGGTGPQSPHSSSLAMGDMLDLRKGLANLDIGPATASQNSGLGGRRQTQQGSAFESINSAESITPTVSSSGSNANAAALNMYPSATPLSSIPSQSRASAGSGGTATPPSARRLPALITNRDILARSAAHHGAGVTKAGIIAGPQSAAAFVPPIGHAHSRDAADAGVAGRMHGGGVGVGVAGVGNGRRGPFGGTGGLGAMGGLAGTAAAVGNGGGGLQFGPFSADPLPQWTAKEIIAGVRDEAVGQFAGGGGGSGGGGAGGQARNDGIHAGGAGGGVFGSSATSTPPMISSSFSAAASLAPTSGQQSMTVPAQNVRRSPSPRLAMPFAPGIASLQQQPIGQHHAQQAPPGQQAGGGGGGGDSNTGWGQGGFRTTNGGLQALQSLQALHGVVGGGGAGVFGATGGTTAAAAAAMTEEEERQQQAAALAAACVMSPIDVPSLIAQKGYNPSVFDTKPAFARYFVIKSYTEDDVHKSLKYEIWASTVKGNERLDRAFRENARKGPIYLFFSVNASGHFCGMAQMITPVDHTTSSNVWAQDGKWKGVFKVRWVFVKDVPNNQLRHIRLANTQEQKPVTQSRDTQELLPAAGQELLRIMASYPARTSLLQDFQFYELQALSEAQRRREQQMAGQQQQHDGAGVGPFAGGPSSSSAVGLGLQSPPLGLGVGRGF